MSLHAAGVLGPGLAEDVGQRLMPSGSDVTPGVACVEPSIAHDAPALESGHCRDPAGRLTSAASAEDAMLQRARTGDSRLTAAHAAPLSPETWLVGAETMALAGNAVSVTRLSWLATTARATLR